MPIEFIPFKTQAEHFQILRKSMPQKDWHWIVPDGASKSKIQKLKWESNRNSLEHSVSTAGSFWLESVIRCQASIEIVSPAVMTVLIRRWSKEKNVGWVKSQNSVKKLAKYFDVFSPIFASRSQNLFLEWLREHPDSIKEWGVWYFAAAQLWSYLEEKNWFPPGVAEALNLLDPDFPWNHSNTLVFDLGFTLDLSAATIVQQLSKTADVKVLVPDGMPAGLSIWKSAYEKLGFKFVEPEEKQSSHQFLRYASSAAALKQTTWQLRKYIEKGIHPEKILVCGDFTEPEKVVLNEHLKFEGFPSSKHLDKNVSKPLEFAWVLNQLSILNHRGKSSDLEWSLYGTPEGHAQSVSSFLNRWRNIYDPESMPQVLQHSRNVSVQLPNGEITAEEWLDTVFQLIGTKQKDLVIDILRAAALKVPESLLMNFEEWTEVFASEAVNLRGTTEAGHDTFAWSDWVSVLFSEFDRVIVPDCSLKALKGDPEQLVSAKDILSIDRDLGIGLKFQDPEKNRVGARWLINHELKEPAQFYFSQSDIDGKLQDPDPIWLKNWMKLRKEDDPEVSLPAFTRWDSTAFAKPSDVKPILSLSEGALQNTLQGLEGDVGKTDRPQAPREVKSTWRLSASQMEKALDCPFVFLASKGFGLSDRPDLDLDVSPIVRGNWYHLVLQQIKSQNIQSLTPTEIDRFLEDLRHKVREEIYDDFMWPTLKKKTSWIVERFLESERKHAAEFADLKFGAAEVDWKADWSKEKKDFVPEGTGDITFTGRIDRVDSGPNGEKVLYDYKNSPSSYTNHDRWLSGNELQLLLYAYVTEKGFLTGVDAGPVEGALYYFLNDMKRNKGLAVEGSKLSDVNRYNDVTQDEKEKLFLELKEKVNFFVAQVEAGIFPAKPSDKKLEKTLCPNCRWRNMCRAPHLN